MEFTYVKSKQLIWIYFDSFYFILFYYDKQIFVVLNCSFDD